MNFHHNPVWGKGQLCLDIGNPAIFDGLPAIDDQPRVHRARRKSPASRGADLFSDLFSPAAEPRKPRAPRQTASPALAPALLVAFIKDELLVQSLVEDIFHVVACVAVSSRWASEWPAVERWIEAASMDEGGSGFWCDAAGLYPADFLPGFWEGIEAQRAEPDQDLREVRAYGENLGEIWPVYRRLTIERNHFMWWPCEEPDDSAQRGVAGSSTEVQEWLNGGQRELTPSESVPRFTPGGIQLRRWCHPVSS